MNTNSNNYVSVVWFKFSLFYHYLILVLYNRDLENTYRLINEKNRVSNDFINFEERIPQNKYSIC